MQHAKRTRLPPPPRREGNRVERRDALVLIAANFRRYLYTAVAAREEHHQRLPPPTPALVEQEHWGKTKEIEAAHLVSRPESQQHVSRLLVHVHVQVVSERPAAVHVGREDRMQDPHHLNQGTTHVKTACSDDVGVAGEG